MTTMTSEDLIERATADLPRHPIPTALIAARRDVAATIDALATIHDDALTRPWGWKGGSEEEVRYGFYRISEAFERAGTDATASLRSAPEPSRAVELIRPATAARWDLQGLLAPLDAATWTADPGGDEWTIALTLGHLIGSQRGYELGSSWWLQQRLSMETPDLPGFPDGLGDDLPDDETEAKGSPAEVRARLDSALDRATERLAGLSPDQLAYAGRWSGFTVDLGFRLSRWASHIREHTIQVEKTLAMLDVRPSEVDRLIRLVLASWGRAEATVYGSLEAEVASGIAVLREAAAQARSTADEVATLGS